MSLSRWSRMVLLLRRNGRRGGRRWLSRVMRLLASMMSVVIIAQEFGVGVLEQLVGKVLLVSMSTRCRWRCGLLLLLLMALAGIDVALGRVDLVDTLAFGWSGGPLILVIIGSSSLATRRRGRGGCIASSASVVPTVARGRTRGSSTASSRSRGRGRTIILGEHDLARAVLMSDGLVHEAQLLGDRVRVAALRRRQLLGQIVRVRAGARIVRECYHRLVDEHERWICWWPHSPRR